MYIDGCDDGERYNKILAKDLEFVFFFTNHADEKDTEGLADLVETADIVALEMFEWEDNIKYTIRALARGEIHPEEFLDELKINRDDFHFFGFISEIINILYRSGVKVFFFDMPNYIAHNYQINDKEKNKLFRVVFENNIDAKERFIRLKRYFNANVSNLVDRDVWMVDSFIQDILPFINSPKRKFKKLPIKIVVVLGAAHVNVYRSIKKRYRSVKRIYNKMPHIATFSSEIVTRIINDIPVPNIVALGAIVEAMVGVYTRSILKTLGVDIKCRIGFFRKFIFCLGEEFIEELLEKHNLIVASEIFKHKFLEYIFEKMD